MSQYVPQTFSTFQDNAQTYIAAQTLKRVKKDVVVYGLGKKEKLPNRFSKTFQFTRYEKLDLPYSPLSEGITPEFSEMSISTVQAVMDQWGSYINLSDVAEITAKHPAMQKGIELLAEQASETIDRECIKLLLSNTSVSYGGSASSRVGLANTDVMTTLVAKKVIAALRGQGAHAFERRNFVGLMDPYVEQDLTADNNFFEASSYSNISALFNAEAGKWMGVRWVVSNLIPTISRLADATTASNATAGSLVAETDYNVKVVAVDNATGFEIASTQTQTRATAAGHTSIQAIMPATTGRRYNVYVGPDGGVLRLSSSLNAPGATVVIGAVPVSGAVAPAHPNTSVEVHFAWVMGQEAFAVPELMSLQTFVTPKGASDSDPLAQRRKASWKVMFKPVICNEDFLERIEIGSAY